MIPTITVSDWQNTGYLSMGEDGYWRAKLWTLWAWRWGNNPKRHQAEKILSSVNEHGFNDDIGVDPFLKLIVEGHGRIETLMALYEKQPAQPPKNVLVAEDKDWLVPVKPLKFESRLQALRYAIQHNTTSTAKAQTADYAKDKLAAAQGEQIGLFAGIPDFQDMAAAEAAAAAVELPAPQKKEAPLEIFDPGDLPDKPEPTGNKSRLIWMAFPDVESLNLALKLLSFGERRSGLSPDSFYASFPGQKYIDRWKKVLGPFSGIETDAAPEVIEGETPDAITQATPAVALEWDEEGLCKECSGKGSQGYSSNTTGQRTKIYCSACGGAGNRETYYEHLKVQEELREVMENDEVTGVEES